MYLTQTNMLRGLTKEQYNCLKLMCQYSNNLFNFGLYNVRQYYFQEKKFLTYESNYHICKENENYKLIQAGVSQQILRVVDRSFKSFFNLIKKAQKGEYRFQDINIPHYKEKGGLFPLIINWGQTSKDSNNLCIPMSREFMKEHPDCRIILPLPERLRDKEIKEIRILPCYNGQYFKIQYVFKGTIEDLNLDKSCKLAIDIGLANLMTCVDTDGNSFIIDGKQLKAINQFYNKRIAYLQSINDKQNGNKKGTKRTKQMNRITMKRNNQCKDYLNKACKKVIDYCIKNKIGKVIIGYNPDFTRGINLGKQTNQKFTQISFGNIRTQLQSLCERKGIEYIEQEESYTSKASFYDLDELPVYNADNPYIGKFSGKRIKRGLYKSKEGKLLNADVNGACNILRKSKQDFNFERLCRGLLNRPDRIRLM